MASAGSEILSSRPLKELSYRFPGGQPDSRCKRGTRGDGQDPKKPNWNGHVVSGVAARGKREHCARQIFSPFVTLEKSRGFSSAPHAEHLQCRSYALVDGVARNSKSECDLF